MQRPFCLPHLSQIPLLRIYELLCSALEADRSSIIPCPHGMGSEPCDRPTGLFFRVISFPSGTPFSFTCTSTYEHTQIRTPQTYPFSFPGDDNPFPSPVRGPWEQLPVLSSVRIYKAFCTRRPAVVIICLAAGMGARRDQLSVIYLESWTMKFVQLSPSK